MVLQGRGSPYEFPRPESPRRSLRDKLIPPDASKSLATPLGRKRYAAWHGPLPAILMSSLRPPKNREPRRARKIARGWWGGIASRRDQRNFHRATEGNRIKAAPGEDGQKREEGIRVLKRRVKGCGIQGQKMAAARGELSRQSGYTRETAISPELVFALNSYDRERGAGWRSAGRGWRPPGGAGADKRIASVKRRAS